MDFDVVIIGGGSAGLSGAVALARSRRSVLVVDAGEPRNATAGHVHNYLTRDGATPAEMTALGRAEVVRFGGEVESGRVTALGRDDDGFVVEVGARSVRARRVLVTTGLRDELPEVPGLAARWGVDVLHCPYCHGWEVRDQRIGVLATGPMAVHQAMLFRRLSPHVTLLAHTRPMPTDLQLPALGIPVVEGEVVAVDAGADGLTGVRLADGTLVELDALVVAPRFTANDDLLAPLGLRAAEFTMGEHVMGTHVPAEPGGVTTVAGLYVAGNITDPQAQVITAAGGGLTAGVAINMDLIAEDTRAVVEAHGGHRVVGERAWEQRYRSTGQSWSGEANPALVDEVAAVAPGTALDAGSGEGGDALWLAGRGWQVTGADIAPTALARSAAVAERLGLTVDWAHVDLTRAAAPGTFDLVSACYLHMPREHRLRAFAHLRDAVAPGGTLLIVGHDPTDIVGHDPTDAAHPGAAEMMWDAEEVLGLLDEGWSIEVAGSRPRRDTHSMHTRDVVVRARRR